MFWGHRSVESSSETTTTMAVYHPHLTSCAGNIHVRRVRVTDTPPTEREMEYLKSNQYISIYIERWRTVVAGAMGTCL